MIINGWVTSKKYWPTYNASLIVTVYMKLENKYLPVSKQEFSSRLPIRFSANLAPIQSGTGSLVVATQLKIKGKTVAIAREIIEYQSGEFEVNLPLTEL